MKLVLVDHRITPPDGFRFTHPETGHVSFSLDETAWFKAIEKYRTDNGFPLIDRADIFDQFCKLLPPGLCRYDNGDKPAWYVNTRLRVSDILRGTKALTQFVVAGFPTVNKELAASRSAICARCPFNVPISGCQPCVGLSSLIVSIGGSIKTPADVSLKTCAVCLCSNLAQTRLPIELLAKTVTTDQIEKYPRDFCWKIAELTQAGLA
jgi:hypothetical protein